MLRVILGLCAESVVRDAETNQVSVFNLLERLTAPEFPVLVQRFSAFWHLSRGVDDADSYRGTALLRLNGEKLADLPVTVGFQGKLQSRLMLQLSGLVIPHPGTLEVLLTLDDVTAEPWVVEVLKGEGETAREVPAATGRRVAV